MVGDIEVCGRAFDEVRGGKSLVTINCGNSRGDGWFSPATEIYLIDKETALKLAQDIINAANVAWPEQGEEGGE